MFCSSSHCPTIIVQSPILPEYLLGCSSHKSHTPMGNGLWLCQIYESAAPTYVLAQKISWKSLIYGHATMGVSRIYWHCWRHCKLKGMMLKIIEGKLPKTIESLRQRPLIQHCRVLCWVADIYHTLSADMKVRDKDCYALTTMCLFFLRNVGWKRRKHQRRGNLCQLGSSSPGAAGWTILKGCCPSYAFGARSFASRLAPHIFLLGMLAR